jgi:hypothetical protein
MTRKGRKPRKVRKCNYLLGSARIGASTDFRLVTGRLEEGKDGREKERNVERSEGKDKKIERKKETRKCKTEQPNGTQCKYHGAGEYGERGWRRH